MCWKHQDETYQYSPNSNTNLQLLCSKYKTNELYHISKFTQFHQINRVNYIYNRTDSNDIVFAFYDVDILVCKLCSTYKPFTLDQSNMPYRSSYASSQPGMSSHVLLWYSIVYFCLHLRNLYRSFIVKQEEIVLLNLIYSFNPSISASITPHVQLYQCMHGRLNNGTPNIIRSTSTWLSWCPIKHVSILWHNTYITCSQLQLIISVGGLPPGKVMIRC